MSRVLTVLVAVLISSPAYAKGKKGNDADGKIRLKLSAPLFLHSKTTIDTDGSSSDFTTSGITIGNGGSRLEGGYRVRIHHCATRARAVCSDGLPKRIVDPEESEGRLGSGGDGCECGAFSLEVASCRPRSRSSLCPPSSCRPSRPF